MGRKKGRTEQQNKQWLMSNLRIMECLLECFPNGLRNSDFRKSIGLSRPVLENHLTELETFGIVERLHRGYWKMTSSTYGRHSLEEDLDSLHRYVYPEAHVFPYKPKWDKWDIVEPCRFGKRFVLNRRGEAIYALKTRSGDVIWAPLDQLVKAVGRRKMKNLVDQSFKNGSIDEKECETIKKSLYTRVQNSYNDKT